MRMYDYHFTACFIIAYQTTMMLFIMGLFMSVMNVTYRAVKMQMYYHHSLDTQDYEMIDFMMKRFKKWLGLTKPKPVSISKWIHYQNDVIHIPYWIS